ncbi:hypothetical protein BN85407670 [Alteracholeplasma palmae J233]|uniref:Uncharacterized protein n=1 Tax=Alteracholeplasma palmae (strain ATCC 49389 / J233) TaxID=1318466 RepID=U4KKP3_ALTPJ|nr:hypothetical protein [Alteracholeplasma palmae]CCV64344.1 hypothetical protein BN85407670 [Alteracholeplasma palmae J233]
MKKRNLYMISSFLLITIVGIVIYFLNTNHHQMIIPKKKHYILYETKNYIKQPIYTKEKNNEFTKAVSNKELIFPDKLKVLKYELTPSSKEQDYYKFNLVIYFKEQNIIELEEKLIFYYKNQTYDLGLLTINFLKEYQSFSIYSLEGIKDNKAHLKSITLNSKNNQITNIYLGSQSLVFTIHKVEENIYRYTIQIPTEDYILDEAYLTLIDSEGSTHILLQYRYFIEHELLKALKYLN